ncbi:STX protein, partial [Atractosteus spatula]|nr:STX protein [Atractosteus spatula]
MKDRLEELRGYREEEEEDDEGGCESPGYNNPVFEEEPSTGIAEFFRVVTGICRELDRLQELSDDIAVKQAQVLCSTTKEQLCAEKQLLAELKGQFAAQARGIQAQLSRMKEEEAGWQGLSAERRIHQCHCHTLARRHREVVAQHYARETEYVGRLKEQIVRQTQLAGLQLPEQEVQRLVESPQAPQLVGSDIQVLQARQHLALAQERRQQLLALEQQIAELHGLFLSLEAAVSEQQAQLDCIEYNVLRAMDYVCESGQEVKKALQYKRQSRLAALVSAVLGLCACCACLSKARGSVHICQNWSYAISSSPEKELGELTLSSRGLTKVRERPERGWQQDLSLCTEGPNVCWELLSVISFSCKISESGPYSDIRLVPLRPPPEADISNPIMAGLNLNTQKLAEGGTSPQSKTEADLNAPLNSLSPRHHSALLHLTYTQHRAQGAAEAVPVSSHVTCTPLIRCLSPCFLSISEAIARASESCAGSEELVRLGKSLQVPDGFRFYNLPPSTPSGEGELACAKGRGWFRSKAPQGPHPGRRSASASCDSAFSLPCRRDCACTAGQHAKRMRQERWAQRLLIG